ncbi:hypothetical protein MHYP_G00018070 [Metynnis hypsauchen]
MGILEVVKESADPSRSLTSVVSVAVVLKEETCSIKANSMAACDSRPCLLSEMDDATGPANTPQQCESVYLIQRNAMSGVGTFPADFNFPRDFYLITTSPQHTFSQSVSRN